MELVTVFKTFYPAEAQLQRSRLEAAGLDAFVNGEMASLFIVGSSIAVGGIQVQVPADQVESARSLLSDSETPSDET